MFPAQGVVLSSIVASHQTREPERMQRMPSLASILEGGTMNPTTYDTILPNIAEVKVDGAQVRVRWKCAATGEFVVESQATMAADSGLAGRVQASVQRSIASEVIYGAARMLSGVLGGAIGRVVSNAAYTAANDINARATAGADYTEASRKAAIVAAFESVQASFSWDDQRLRYIECKPGAGAPSVPSA